MGYENMKDCIDKLNELKLKYPELVRANEISRYVSVITSIFASVNEVEIAFDKLEKLLEGDKNGNI